MSTIDTTARSAMKLELEALAVKFSEGWHEGIKIDASDIMLLNDVAQALEEQPAPVAKPHEQEPVAWMYDWICDGKLLEGWIAHKESEIPRLLASNIRPLYTSQPAQQEPVAWRVKVETTFRDGSVNIGYQLRNERLSKYDEPLYTSPPTLSLAQRQARSADTWVGLTDELEALFTNIDHAISSGAWNVQTGSQTWELIHEAKAAHGIKENT